MFLAKSYCDIGNYSAGYMAGISGQGWKASPDFVIVSPKNLRQRV